MLNARADISACLQAECGGLRHGLCVKLTAQFSEHERRIGTDISDGAVIRYNIALESPLFAENFPDEVFIGRRGNSIDPVVGGHDGPGAAFPDAALENRQVILAERGFIHVG